MNAMIARRTNKGHNATESRDMLAGLIRSHAGDNLAAALVYNEFATERQAHKFAAAAREELAAAGLAAEAQGEDPMPFFDLADAQDDAQRAADARRLVISADAPTYWG